MRDGAALGCEVLFHVRAARHRRGSGGRRDLQLTLDLTLGREPPSSPACPPGPAPEERIGPGFTEVGLPGVVPFPGPDSPPRNEWSDWYASTGPSSPFEPPAQQPQPYQATAYQQQPMPHLGQQQQYRPPFEPPVRRSLGLRAPLFWSALSAALAIAVVVTVLLLHPFSHHAAVNDAANSTKTAAPGPGRPERVDPSHQHPRR